MDKVLRDIKVFETTIDEIQDYYNRTLSLDDLVLLHHLDALKISIEEYKRQSQSLDQNLKQLQMDFIVFDLAACSRSELAREKLQSCVERWSETTKEGERKGYKSLLELELSKFVQSAERVKTSDGIKAVTIHLGIRLSRILVQYVLLFAWSEPDVMKKVLDISRETIRSRCFVKNSVVNHAFVSVVELVLREMRNLERDAEDKKGESMKKLPFGERENDLLDVILFDVFYLETALCCPFFPTVSSNTGLQAFGLNLGESFKPKLRKLSSKLNECARELSLTRHECLNIKKFGAMLDMRIIEIWSKLDV
ncbi:hypothetical protein L484_004915 [Morus notabilis]|uniref:Uncharacterized protein n=1 Tax=Morus notabilis TaxID=981085 RepID=W9RE75_9ROSA|nr:hypothetical protein L484_004915 [Morus notabilis]